MFNRGWLYSIICAAALLSAATTQTMAQMAQTASNVPTAGAPAAFRLSNARMEVECVNRVVSVWMKDKESGKRLSAPFASFQLPTSSSIFLSSVAEGISDPSSQNAFILVDDAVLTLSLPADALFLTISVLPGAANRESGREPKTIQSIRLPEITLSDEFAPADCKALGSAGLTDVDGHKGSYMFLAIAQPETRKGVVAAWGTSYNGSGIVFSRKTEDARNVVVQPELQFGRLELPSIPANVALGRQAAKENRTQDQSEETNRSEVFLIGQFDDCLDGLESYANAVAKLYNIQMKPQVSGYCTWYSNKFGGAGSEESTKLFADVAFEKLVPFGMSYFQIDDKWQLGNSSNGPRKNFTAHNPQGPYPSGMKPTAEYLNSKGLVAGIWFMPFSGNWNDPYYADKQEWFVKSAIDYPAPGEKNTRRFSGIDQKKGAPYETFWGGTSLDMTDKNVEKYVHDEVDQIANKWGYKYFKYDGMWTAMACEQLYVNDEYRPDDLGLQIFDDMSKTNVQIYRKGLKMVRAAAGDDVFILGCNVSQNMRTMGASYGLVDAMRIGPDNGSNWSGICAGPVRGTARYFYNGRVWYNDPDPVYVRDSIPLAHAQLITSWAAISGQLFAFSDWLPELSEERVNVLQRTIAPVRLYTARPLDLFEAKLAHIWKLTGTSSKQNADSRTVFGLFNWDENNPLSIDQSFEQLGLDPSATYVGFDFWANAFVAPFKKRLTCELPGGTCRVLSIVKLEDAPVLVGTNRHVASPLFEVENVRWDAEKLVLSGTSTVVANDPYELRVILPEGLKLRQSADFTCTAAVDGWTTEERFRTVRVKFKPEKSEKTNWTIAFEKGVQETSDCVSKPTGLMGNPGYSRIWLTWDESTNFGYVLTKTSADGTVKTFALTVNQFIDSDVQLGDAYSYSLQTKGWDGNLSEALQIKVEMPAKIVLPSVPPMPDVNIADLKPVKASSGWGKMSPNKAISGHPLTIDGKVYDKGVGVHATSNLVYDVPAGMTRFVATVGLDDYEKTDDRRSVVVRVWSDVCEMGEPQVLLSESPLMSNETSNVWHFDLPIEGRTKQIRLEVTDAADGNSCDHVDWVNAGFISPKK